MHSQPCVLYYLERNPNAHPFNLAYKYARWELRSLFDIEESLGRRQPRVFSDQKLRSLLVVWRLLGLCLHPMPTPRVTNRREIDAAISALELRLYENAFCYTEKKTMVL